MQCAESRFLEDRTSQGTNRYTQEKKPFECEIYANTYILRNTTSQNANGYAQEKNTLNVQYAKSHFLRNQDSQSTNVYIL